MKHVALRSSNTYKLNGKPYTDREELLQAIQSKLPDVTMMELSAHIGGMDVPKLSQYNIQPRLKDLVPTYQKDPREFQETARKSRSKVIYYKGTKLYGYNDLYVVLRENYKSLDCSPESIKSLCNPKRSCKYLIATYPELTPKFIDALDDPSPFIREHDLVILQPNLD